MSTLYEEFHVPPLNDEQMVALQNLIDYPETPGIPVKRILEEIMLQSGADLGSMNGVRAVVAAYYVGHYNGRKEAGAS
jgi:hypothetical protein